jgi:hypothetical protein
MKTRWNEVNDGSMVRLDRRSSSRFVRFTLRCIICQVTDISYEHQAKPER